MSEIAHFADVAWQRAFNPDNNLNRVYLGKIGTRQVVGKVFFEEQDFYQEWRNIKRAQSLNAVEYLGADVGKQCIFMAYLADLCLLDYWRQAHFRRLNQRVLWLFAIKLIKVLLKWQQAQLAHGDLKAAHIFISAQQITLIDFGLTGFYHQAAHNIDARLPQNLAAHITDLQNRDYYNVLQIIDNNCALAQGLANYAQLCDRQSFTTLHSSQRELLHLAQQPLAWQKLLDFCIKLAAAS